MIKTVIFDMDGLMFDNEQLAFKAYQTILKEQNLDMDEDFYKLFLGQSMENANRLMKERYGQNFDAYGVAKEVHVYLYDYFEKNGVPLKKGLIELLEYLKNHHYQTIVASSSSRERLDKILGYSHTLSYFNTTICGSEAEHTKPEPDIFLKACEKLNVLPSESLVLEDSEAGIEAAYRAHIKAICIPDMKYPADEYIHKAYKVLDSLDEVINELEKGIE